MASLDDRLCDLHTEHSRLPIKLDTTTIIFDVRVFFCSRISFSDEFEHLFPACVFASHDKYRPASTYFRKSCARSGLRTHRHIDDAAIDPSVARLGWVR